MYGQTSFDASKGNTAPKGITALLLGLIICYQVVNHIFLHRAVNHEEDEFDHEGGCAASGYSSLCMEAQLFQGWHEMPPDSPADLEGMLSISSSSSTEQKSPSTSLAPKAEKTPVKQALRGDTGEQAAAKGTSEELKPEALEGMLWDLAWKMGGGDKSHEAPEKHKKKHNAFMAKAKEPKTKKKSFTEGLTDLQHKLEAKMKSQAQRHAEHRALRALSVAARGHSLDSGKKSEAPRTEWAQNLDDLTHELQAQMEDWRKERADHAAAFAAEKKQKAPPKEDDMTPWAHNLDDLTHEIQDHMEHRKKERAEHAAAHARAHAARLRAAHAIVGGEGAEAEIKTPFMSEVEALGRELCQDPSRRDRPACAQFRHESPEAEAKASPKSEHENAMAHIKLLEKHLKELESDRAHDNEEIKKESTDFLKELCSNPARHNYPTCAQFFGKSSAAPETTAKPASKSLRSSQKAASKPKEAALQPHALHWTAMNESEVSQDLHQHHVGESQLVMQRHELRGAHWEGKIPKVACITVLPQGQVTENLMRYFMDNFKLQHYDGEKELVLVYHHNDKEAARIAHLYADGTTVKAAVARGETEFPSATAYRYGAWVAHGADMVARWDFEAWHHPNRLSMQIRAIVLSKRAASLVPMVTAFDDNGKNGTVAGGVGPHGSMMGDAAWMRKHWMPLLEEESAVAHGLHSSDLVQVDMPELLAYHDVTMLGSASLN